MSLFDASNYGVLITGNQSNQQLQRSIEESTNHIVDPLDNFRNSASVMGLSYEFSRFNEDSL